ncbi:T-complex protein 1 [Lentinula edodes]|nr:T-complex protein 1 [Lentinula edodes]
MDLHKPNKNQSEGTKRGTKIHHVKVCNWGCSEMERRNDAQILANKSLMNHNSELIKGHELACTKASEELENILSALVVEAALMPPNPNKLNVDNVLVAKIMGGGLSVSGREPEAKVAVFTSALHIAQTETKVTVFMRNADENTGSCSGVKVIIAGSSVGEFALYCLNCFNIRCSEGCSFDVLETDDIGGDRVTILRQLPRVNGGENTRTATVHAMKKYSSALKVVPRQLAESALGGAIAHEVVTRIWAKHEEKGGAQRDVDAEAATNGALKASEHRIYDSLDSIISKPAGGPEIPQQSGNWDGGD